MNDTINLLIRDDKPKASETKGLKRYRWLALGSFFFTLGISLVFLLLIIFSPLSSLVEKKNVLVRNIASEKFLTMLSLSDRLKSISSVVAKRPVYESILATLQKQIPQGATVQAIKMTNKAVTFGVNSSSLDLLDTFIANVKSQNEQSTRLFRTFSLTNLTYNNAQHMYLLTVELTTL